MGRTFILGGGMTGLAAGYAPGLPVYEATGHPGGICCSYYMRPGSNARLNEPPPDGEAYRFEIGGGHWIFGGEPTVLEFINRLCATKTYFRKSSVFLPDKDLYVPYPLQNHLRLLDPAIASQALREMSRQPTPSRTMQEWLRHSFGETLCALFFEPFHALYTAGLYDRIAPQDSYKSPVDLALVIAGAAGGVAPVGYNTRFVYPAEGLDALARRMAGKCDVQYDKRARRIEPMARLLELDDGTIVEYDSLVSTLPLSLVMQMCGLSVESVPDPHTSVLVLNIGARRGPHCPDDHWIYVPASRSGFHRVGFYSAVDAHFLPLSARASLDRVSIYVERAYLPKHRPSPQEQATYIQGVVRELQDFGYIGDIEVVDPTWIEVAYTWSWPQSQWRSQALRKLSRRALSWREPAIGSER